MTAIHGIDELEELVDNIGIETVIRGLINVCEQKAQYLYDNWQDTVAASWWSKKAKQLEKVC
jgi:hypothetical protein